MPCFRIKVKWGRELFEGIEVNTDWEPGLLKAQLFSITGVEPGRQKIMFKGNILRDTEWNIELKEQATVLLLGSKEEIPGMPNTPMKFIEDMTNTELTSALELDTRPSGLRNMGNTCYMNATLQCLKSIPELREALNQFEQEDYGGNASSIALTSSMKLLFNQMEKSKSVNPILLLHHLHKASPQFLQTEENGFYRQQDANECWLELLKLLQQLPAIKRDQQVTQVKQYQSFVEQYLAGTFEIRMNCPENPDDNAIRSTEQFLQLSCFISPDVKDMNSGLISEMKEKLTKYSQDLGRDAVFNRIYLISRLPAYFTVQFIRFQYKEKERINAKILKDVKFPIEFDAYELCTPELQEKLSPIRAEFTEMENRKSSDTPETNLHSLDSENQDSKIDNYCFEDDIGSNNSGYYTLKAILTHKGRSSSSGHYVAWVRKDAESWYKLDDDVVSSVTTEEILRLSGGGDWHCAYVLLYEPRNRCTISH